MKIKHFFRKTTFLTAFILLLSFTLAHSQTKILWGYGDNFSGYNNSGIGQQTDIKIISHWYNGPQDSWIWGYSGTKTVSNYYAQGYGIQLIVWLGPGAFNNSMAYAAGDVVTLNNQDYYFPEDLKRLTKVFMGEGPVYGPLYIVLFSEVETYYSSGDEVYKKKLQKAYLDAVKSIHEICPHAEVGLGFGGYGWPMNSLGTRDLSYWEPSIEASDFVCTQSMQQYNNWSQNTYQIRSGVKQLGSYGKPVMLSHFKIWGNPNNKAMGPVQTKPAFINFMDDMFTESTLSDLYDDGLRMFVFMDDEYIRDRNGESYDGIDSYNDVAFNTARDFINNHNDTDPVMKLDNTPAAELSTRQLLLDYTFDDDKNFTPDINASSNFSASDLTFPSDNVSFAVYSENTDPHGGNGKKWIRDTGYQQQNINATSVKEAVDADNVSKRNDYVSFAITPDAGQTLSLSWLSFDMQMRTGSNLSSPPALDYCAAVFYKKGDYMFRIGETFKVSAQTPGATSGWNTCPVDFSKVKFTENESVEFRIYFWRESESISGLHSRWLEIDNIRLYGSNETSGIKKNESNKYEIYPNPAKDVVYISGVNDFNVSISDMMGRVVLSVENANNQIDLSILEKGVYLVNIDNIVTKLIKK